MHIGSCSTGEVESFVRAAVPGNRLVYFVCRFGQTFSAVLEDTHGAGYTLMQRVTNRLRALANAGLVDLVQDRLHDQQLIAYEAVWREYEAEPLTDWLALPMIESRK
ncbi:hypothetical protein [Novosphingobium sp. FKTRR1]|uniref:hypothetical protein n=1 Tax=Novosphingobium sp. FKTRR1 TaxID=2879118 RepID=UPI001CF0BCE1|nr:hypothetical protein [Novosphingobium sp. FKTRR1]